MATPLPGVRRPRPSRKHEKHTVDGASGGKYGDVFRSDQARCCGFGLVDVAKVAPGYLTVDQPGKLESRSLSSVNGGAGENQEPLTFRNPSLCSLVLVFFYSNFVGRTTVARDAESFSG